MTIQTQLVGAFGEKMAEAELLRRGWRTANFNTSITNAAEHDLIAEKGSRLVQLRVKTCGPGWNSFQFSCPVGKEFATDVPANDYTILVLMREDRRDDKFYIMPTSILRKQINDARRRKSSLDFGLCSLKMRPHR